MYHIYWDIFPSYSNDIFDYSYITIRPLKCSDCILVSGKLSLHILFFFIIFLVFSGIIKNKFLNYE